jgi:soluble lytic murein transglycosylase-like protein
MHVESADDSRAVPHAGTMGLMQIMPARRMELRARYRLGRDAFDPRDNILGGTASLREMHERRGWPRSVAACNVGAERHRQYLVDGRSPPGETRSYIAYDCL